MDTRILEETIIELRSSGIQFCIQFIGSVIVEKSMNMLSTEQQNKAALSFIKLVVEAANLIPSININNKEKEEEEEINQDFEFIKDAKPEISNIPIDINISSTAIIIVENSEYSSRILHRFNIRDVSLVSKGKNELNNYFCFFAKVPQNNEIVKRKCFVFDADTEMEEIHDVIWMAFEICDMEQKNKVQNQEPTNNPNKLANNFDEIQINNNNNNKKFSLPKIRIENQSSTTPPAIPPRRSFASTSNCCYSTENCENCPDSTISSPDEDIGINNLSTTDKKSTLPENLSENCRARSSSSNSNDMVVNMSTENYEKITKNLMDQLWFHDLLSRQIAESLICEDGQFLVRRSPNIQQQIVLSGMHAKSIKHICLVGNDGKISSIKGKFDCIVDLINYYMLNKQPLIFSQGIVIHLDEPIKKNI